MSPEKEYQIALNLWNELIEVREELVEYRVQCTDAEELCLACFGWLKLHKFIDEKGEPTQKLKMYQTSTSEIHR